MVSKPIVSALALATGISQVAGQICAGNVETTTAGLKFIIEHSSVPGNNFHQLQLRPSKTGDFSYVAIDKTSPVLEANIEDGVFYAVDKSLAPTGATGYLADFNVDLTFNPPTTTGKFAFANVNKVANASDPSWILSPAASHNMYSIWRQEPVNTLNGWMVCEADFDLNEDGSPWYFLQYVDWVSGLPESCDNVAMTTNLTSVDMPTC